MPFGRRSARVGRIGAVAAAIAAIVALAVAVLNVPSLQRWTASLSSQRVTAFGERDWLMVADFENHTTDKMFDKALDMALAVGLGQSRYVNVVPPSQIEGALRRMRVATPARIDGPTARAIAQRDGIKLILVPSIVEVGGVYQLSGLLQDPNGTMRATAVARARHKAEVLASVDELVRSIRNDLGEAPRSIERQSKPLDRVTTSSLEALKAFSLGREAHRAAHIDEARSLYEEAVRLDPSFTAAKAALGMLNFDLRDRETGKQLLTEAIQDIDGLTTRERYSVLAFHAVAIENDGQKAIDYYKALLAEYPDAGTAYNNIGRAYMQMRRHDDAIAAFKQALRLEPNVMLTYNSLNQIYLYELGDLDAAAAVCQQQLAYNDQNPWPYNNLGWIALGRGNPVQAREQFQKALSINPRSTDYLFRLAIAYRLERRYRDALDTVLKAAAIDPTARAAYYDAGIAARGMGDERSARSHFATFRQLVEKELRQKPKCAACYLELAEVLSRSGDHAGATSAAGRAMALDPSQHFEYANFLSIEGRRDDAIHHLQLAIERGYRNFVWMKVGPDLEPLAGDPRFGTLVATGLKH